MRKSTLLNRISSGELEQRYTPLVRLAAHTIMWLVILLIQFVLYETSYTEPALAAFLFALRNMLTTAFSFYFVVYYVIPALFRKGGIVAGILCLPVLFIIANLLNYATCRIIYTNALPVDNVTVVTVRQIAESAPLGRFMLNHTLKASWGYVTSAASVIAIKLALDIIRQTTRQLRVERDKLDLELNFLKSQLNPHFLFNTLNNIYTLSLKGSPRASDLILHLAAMMRYTIYESDAPQVPLKKEVEFLRNYIDLERVRYGSDAEVRFECNEEEIKDQEIAPLLIFPFVENAFKHGQAGNGKCMVQVKINAGSKTIAFQILNSKGDKNTVRRSVGGIGQANSKKRLELLYPDNHQLTIEDLPDQYKVNLILTNPVSSHGDKNQVPRSRG